MIIYAFAVNNENRFEPKHFGDADKYVLYNLKNGEFSFHAEFKNKFKNMDEIQLHGSKKKGNSIISFLKGKGVEVLVSKQFGKNIKMVNEHFIPVIISLKTINEVFPVLLKNIKWINEDLRKKPDNYKLFDLRKGNLKIAINKN